MKTKPLIDSKVYAVLCGGAYKTSLTLDQAKEFAKKIEAEWAELGKVIPAKIMYRDGTIVKL